MFAALIVVATIFSAPLPLAPPVLTRSPTIVMDGCNTATAARVTQLRRAFANKQGVHALLHDVVAQRDGLVCLMESAVLVDLHIAHVEQELVQRVFVDAMRSRVSVITRRARALAMQLRDRDPSGYDALMRRADHWRKDELPSPREPGDHTIAAR